MMAPLSELDLEQMRSGNHGHQASRDSGQFTNTKGLLNGPGQNNCFLNSAVQVSSLNFFHRVSTERFKSKFFFEHFRNAKYGGLNGDGKTSCPPVILQK